MSKKLTINLWGKEYKLSLEISSYRNNNTLAIKAYEYDEEFECDFPCSNITVNLPHGFADDHTQYVDTNNWPGIDEFLIDAGIAEDTDIMGVSGFCIYPLMEFNLERLKEYE